jgi:hypothetical protein
VTLRAIILGVAFGAAVAIATHACIIGGVEIGREWIWGQEFVQKNIRLEWFLMSSLPGFGLGVCVGLLCLALPMKPGEVLFATLSAVGVLAILLPVVCVAIWGGSAETLYLWYLFGLFLLSGWLGYRRFLSRAEGPTSR